VSDWIWTKRAFYVEGRGGNALANISHYDDCWRVFARVSSQYVKPDVSARLPVEWTEEQVRAWVERWADAQAASIKEAA
jgi:hypothetical protein